MKNKGEVGDTTHNHWASSSLGGCKKCGENGENDNKLA